VQQLADRLLLQKKEKERKFHSLGQKRREKPCEGSHTAATGSSLTVCITVNFLTRDLLVISKATEK